MAIEILLNSPFVNKRCDGKLEPQPQDRSHSGERFITREMAQVHMFECIKVYYNLRCLHLRLGYLSTETFEAHQAA